MRSLSLGIFLINYDLLLHELEVSVMIAFGGDSRDLSTLLVDACLQRVFHSLFEVEVLKVINDRHMVNVSTTCTQEGMLRLLEFLEYFIV